MYRPLLSIVLILGSVAGAAASGGVGIYGIVDKVVFEPADRTPERVQVWGVFAYVDGRVDDAGEVSPVRRGYLYFTLPAGGPLADTARREWMDLRAVAGTGQAVGFGAWGYIGRFGGLDPGSRSSMPPYILELYPGRGETTDLRVRPETEKPSAPAVYQTNVGVVKLPALGSRADVVRRLQEHVRQ